MIFLRVDDWSNYELPPNMVLPEQRDKTFNKDVYFQSFQSSETKFKFENSVEINFLSTVTAKFLIPQNPVAVTI